jgi:hypothetical protein
VEEIQMKKKRPRRQSRPKGKSVNGREENNGKPPTDATTEPLLQGSVPASNRFQLSLNLNGVGDPIEGNPFSSEDPRHAVWQESTLAAEQELCRLNSNYSAGVANSQSEHVTRFVALAVAKFDIWARRYVTVVWTRNDLRGFDQWVFNYANAWLADVEEKNLPHKDFVLHELRAHLISRMEFWKAQARNYVAKIAISQNPTNLSPQADATVGSEKTLAAQTREAVKKDKQVQTLGDEIRGYMQRENLTNAQACERFGNISVSTLRALKSGDRRRYGQKAESKVLLVVRK